MPTLSATPVVNAAVAGANSLPALISNLEKVDPALAQQLTTKPLIASKTPWGVAAAYVVGVVSARYGLGLDETATQLVAGVFVLVGSYLMRLTVRQPAAVVPPAPDAASKSEG